MLIVDFINVGYGDSILIREQKNGEKAFNILIDCGDISTGPKDLISKRTKAADFLMENNIKEIDLLVLSHLHLDHVGGLNDLIPNIKIAELWSNYIPEKVFWNKKICCDENISSGTDCLITSMNIYCKSLFKMAQSGTKMRYIKSLHGMKTYCNGRLKLEYFSSDESLQIRQNEILDKALWGKASSSEFDELDQFINNTSIRLRITYGKRTVELPGDIGVDEWERCPPKPCTILKLPHHGHKESISELLLDRLLPKYAVISVSNFRHDDCPSHKIIKMLQQKNIKLFFTDAVPFGEEPPVYHDSVKFILPYEKKILAPLQSTKDDSLERCLT